MQSSSRPGLGSENIESGRMEQEGAVSQTSAPSTSTPSAAEAQDFRSRSAVRFARPKMRKWVIGFYDERAEAIECISLWAYTARTATLEAFKMLTAEQVHNTARFEATRLEAER